MRMDCVGDAVQYLVYYIAYNAVGFSLSRRYCIFFISKTHLRLNQEISLKHHTFFMETPMIILTALNLNIRLL